MKGDPIPSPKASTALLPWLHQALGASMPKGRVTQLLRMGRIAVNGAAVTRHDHAIGPADTLALLPRAAAPADVSRPGCRVPVIHFDDNIIVVDKPAGLLSVATETNTTDTAFTRLRQWLEQNRGGRPFVVHRLDRETSGLLLFARSAEMRDRLQAGWDHVSKIYLALCSGVPHPPEGTIDSYLEEGDDLKVRVRPREGGGAKRAISRYRALATRRGITLMEVALETGRKHQIRVHMASLGCPVAGDRVYGSGEGPRMALHAWKLAFQHPGTGHDMAFEAPPPSIFGPIPNNK